MTRALDGRSVFVASPSGLDVERKQITDTFSRYNELRGLNDGVWFVLREGEQTAGGVARPQGKINPDLRRCDFAVVVLSDRWGSRTGSPEGHTSGTQEEFEVAVKCLADETSNLREVLVLFKSVPIERRSNPDLQLSTVIAFQEALDDSKQFHARTFDSLRDLDRLVDQSIQEWSQQPLSARVPRTVVLPDYGAHEDPAGDSEGRSVSELIVHAEEAMNHGQPTRAESILAFAAADRDPEAIIAYAKFMRRSGRLDRSAELNGLIIDDPAIALSADPVVAEMRAFALSNMGVVRRTQGRLRESIDALREAVTTGEAAGQEDPLVYALDNLGISLQQGGDLAGAERNFERALTIRKAAGDSAGMAQSYLHRARRHRRNGESEQAIASARDALALAEKAGDELLRANAHGTVGDLLLAAGDDAGAGNEFERSRDLNTKHGNNTGTSVALVGLARCAPADGRFEDAIYLASQSRKMNLETGSASGLAIATQVLGEAELAADDPVTAQPLLEQAVELNNVLGHRGREAESAAALAEAYFAGGQAEAGAAQIQTARVLAARTKNPDLMARVDAVEQRILHGTASE